jgi:magnesium chelatase subunit H
VIVTMDPHLATATARAQRTLARELPGLTLTLHAAAEWGEDARSLQRCRDDIARADIVVGTMLFMEDHYQPVLDALRARRDGCDAMLIAMSAAEVTRLTRLGSFDMSAPANPLLSLLKKLRGKSSNAGTAGAQQMKMLRRIPQLLRFIPGTAQTYAPTS